MSEDSVCPIWGTVAEIKERTGLLDVFGYDVNSPRAGGEYFISEEAKSALSAKDERFKARLTSWLIEQRKEAECPIITPQTIEEIVKRRGFPISERVDRLLQYIKTQTSRIGEPLAFHVPLAETVYPAEVILDVGEKTENIDDHISKSHQNNWKMMAWSECTNFEEVKSFLEYAKRKSWIEYDSVNESCALTIEGYTRLDEPRNVTTDSSQVFVAMWFDDSMKCALENGIKPGIRDAGYEPLPINEKVHINKIEDEIIAEIKRSRFVVADFTHKKIKKYMKKKERKESGARGSVYYEAGYAHALEIPVIFTCRKDLIKKVHFDTNHYNHIIWEPEKLPDLRKALKKCIVEVIGRGPGKTQDAE